MNRLELHPVHESLNASFVEESDWLTVDHYGDPRAELHALKKGCGMRDRSDRAVVRVEGRDRSRFLNGMLTNDVKRIDDHHASYALLLTVQGRVLGDLWLLGLQDAFWMILEPLSRDTVLSTLDRYLIADKVDFKDQSAEMGMLSLTGPDSLDLLKHIFGDDIPSDRGKAQGETSPGVVPTLTLDVDGAPVMVVFSDRFGVGGVELLAPRGALGGLWQRLRDAGATAVGQRAEEGLRIERGVPRVGIDLGQRSIAVEGGSYMETRAISFEKGCYIGQEVVCRVVQRGQINYLLSAFRLKDEEEIELPAALFHQGKTFGRLTSCTESPDYGRIGLGFVHRNVRAPGLMMKLASESSNREVEVLTEALNVDPVMQPPTISAS